MAVTVVDASALAAALFNESEGERIEQTLAGASLVAPAILPLEIANICLTKLRRTPEQRRPLIAAYGRLVGMGVLIMDVDHDDVLRLAVETGLTAYDAAYLWLSRALHAPLVTLDRKLGQAAGAPKGN